MRYNVDCPHCGKPRSLSDSCLWPESEYAPSYPDTSEAQECLDCPGWMRVVIHREAGFHVERCNPPPWIALQAAVEKARVRASRVGPMHAAWDTIAEAEIWLQSPYGMPPETLATLLSELKNFG
jgi:hypothetical protein